MRQVRFIDKDKNQFLSTLRKRVDRYFKERQLSRHCNTRMVFKTIILMSAYIVPFFLLVLWQPPVAAGLALWAVMGFAIAGVGMSVMHDANHGAYSPNSRVNFWLGHTLNMLGGSVVNWKMQHNTLHHTYTNVTHMDEDIADKGVLRLSPHTPVRWVHRFQHIYALLIYGILTIYWVMVKDFTQFYRYVHKGLIRMGKRKKSAIITRMVMAKSAYLVLFLVLPLTVFNVPAWEFLAGFAMMHFIAGVVLTVIFQLAHTVEGTTHPMPDEAGAIENNWAIHQMHTTVNFSRRNKWLSWYVGGLNFQVEHHLFPSICHVHYPALAPIVQKTAHEFGIPYLENRTFFSAIRSHLRLLKRLGRRG